MEDIEEKIEEKIEYENPEDIEEHILVEIERLKEEDDRIKKENIEAKRQKMLEQYYRDKYIDKIHIFFALIGGLLSWVIIYAAGNLGLEEMLIRIIVVIAVFYIIGLWLRSYVKSNVTISDEEIIASLGFEERSIEYENLQKKEDALRKLREEKITLEQKLKEIEDEKSLEENRKLVEETMKNMASTTSLETEQERPKFEGNLNYDEEPDFSVK